MTDPVLLTPGPLTTTAETKAAISNGKEPAKMAGLVMGGPEFQRR